MVALAGPGWVLAPSLQLYVHEVDLRWPNRDRTSDGSIGDAAHAARDSDHNPYEGYVHAVDIDENVAPGVDLRALWDYAIDARDPRDRYLIYEGQIVKSYVDSAGHKAWKPYPYTGINAHEHHLHRSINRTAQARDDMRPWGIADAFAIAPTPHPEEDDDMPKVPPYSFWQFKGDARVYQVAADGCSARHVDTRTTLKFSQGNLLMLGFDAKDAQVHVAPAGGDAEKWLRDLLADAGVAT